MRFGLLDYVVIAGYFILMILIAWYAKTRGQESLDDYFAGGKNLPWWLAGVSMVATTFAADTPLAITGLVANQGIAGNWFWLSWMFSGVITIFLYAKLWKRADVITDCEFIELRYGGKPASFLRGFRALYFAFPFNCVIMGWVTVGMAKVMSVITGADQWTIILILYSMTAIYIAITGLWGVVVTDFIQFFIAMAGSIALAYFSVDYVGGLDSLKTQLATNVNFDILNFNPLSSPEIPIATALIWVGMAWWAAWYPGAEPGGGGYVAQRVFSTKNEKHAVGATLLHNILMYAVRPWPWIIVALTSVIVFPNLMDKEAGYPMMMNEVLPVGWFGLMIIAFLAAFVSTISTQLNWGTSYLINDFYARFIKKEDAFESPDKAQKHYVFISRLATIAMAGIAIIVSYFFDSVKGGWEFILSLSAGIGGVMMLRWFWWRVNAWSEIVAMVVAFAGAVISSWLGFDFAWSMIFTTSLSTVSWLVATFVTTPESHETLSFYYAQVRPMGKGWAPYSNGVKSTDKFLPAIIKIVVTLAIILLFLWGMKYLFFGSAVMGITFIVLGFLGIYVLFKNISNL